jgi:hypothetical protein
MRVLILVDAWNFQLRAETQIKGKARDIWYAKLANLLACRLQSMYQRPVDSVELRLYLSSLPHRKEQLVNAALMTDADAMALISGTRRLLNEAQPLAGGLVEDIEVLPRSFRPHSAHWSEKRVDLREVKLARQAPPSSRNQVPIEKRLVAMIVEKGADTMLATDLT